MKNILKRGSALFVAIMCLTSIMSLSFATSTGWPTDGALDGETISPTVSATEGMNAIDTTQEEIQNYHWTESDIAATIDYTTTADSRGDIMSANIYSQYSDTLPDVSIDDLIDWSNKKGFEIIKFLQTFIQPFAIIMFMISSIMILVGSIGNQQLSGKGFMGLLMSVLCYAGCLYSSSILSTLVAWLGT